MTIMRNYEQDRTRWRLYPQKRAIPAETVDATGMAGVVGSSARDVGGAGANFGPNTGGENWAAEDGHPVLGICSSKTVFWAIRFQPTSSESDADADEKKSEVPAGTDSGIARSLCSSNNMALEQGNR